MGDRAADLDCTVSICCDTSSIEVATMSDDKITVGDFLNPKSTDEIFPSLIHAYAAASKLSDADDNRAVAV